MTDRNYTPEMEARLRAEYDAEAPYEDRKATVEALADELGRTPASIRAKLVSMELYKAKETESKTKGVRKEHLVSAIAKAMDVDEDVVGSLEKANKVALAKVLKALTADA